MATRTSLHFLIQTSVDVPEHDDWLSEQEKRVLSGLRFPKRRNDWRLGRWTAKLAVARYLGKDFSLSSSLEIRAAQDGAPEAFWEGAPAPVSVSISHSRNRSLSAVGPGNHRIGCDLEWLEPREANFAEDYFTAEEVIVTAEAPLDTSVSVNLIWSAKESAMKALREGLRRDTRSIRIRPDFLGQPDSWNSWTGQCLESSRLFYGWWRTGDGFIYTLASDLPTSLPLLL